MVRIVKSRIDYVEHAINFADWCPLQCDYCYYHSPKSLWRKKRGIKVERKVDKNLEELRAQLHSFRVKGDILISARHEPLHALFLETTIEILHTIEELRPDLLPHVRILSKEGWFNDSFSARLRLPDGIKFGQTITTLNQGVAYLVETSAAEVTRLSLIHI